MSSLCCGSERRHQFANYVVLFVIDPGRWRWARPCWWLRALGMLSTARCASAPDRCDLGAAGAVQTASLRRAACR